MKVAIIHDSLIDFGGAERILLVFLEMFPHADIYTAYSDKTFIKTFIPSSNRKRIHCSWTDGTAIAKHGSLFQILSPWVWTSFNLEKYDLVLSMTSYLGAYMVRVSRPVHIAYIHSLPKNLYALDPPFLLQSLLPYSNPLRRFIKKSLLSIPCVLSSSEHIKRVLLEKTGVLTRILYPPISIPRESPRRKKGKYYMCVSRIDKSKSLEIAVVACTKMNLQLKIVGNAKDSQYEQYLRSIAGPTIEFLGFLTDTEIHDYYRSAKALIFTSKNEDFGMVPIEAMAHGVPIIAYYGGAIKNTVKENITGVFFREHTSQSLCGSLINFEEKKFSSLRIYHHSQRYSKEKFISRLSAYVNTLIKARDQKNRYSNP